MCLLDSLERGACWTPWRSDVLVGLLGEAMCLWDSLEKQCACWTSWGNNVLVGRLGEDGSDVLVGLHGEAMCLWDSLEK